MLSFRVECGRFQKCTQGPRRARAPVELIRSVSISRSALPRVVCARACWPCRWAPTPVATAGVHRSRRHFSWRGGVRRRICAKIGCRTRSVMAMVGTAPQCCARDHWNPGLVDGRPMPQHASGMTAGRADGKRNSISLCAYGTGPQGDSIPVMGRQFTSPGTGEVARRAGEGLGSGSTFVARKSFIRPQGLWRMRAGRPRSPQRRRKFSAGIRLPWAGPWGARCRDWCAPASAAGGGRKACGLAAPGSVATARSVTVCGRRGFGARARIFGPSTGLSTDCLKALALGVSND